MGDSGGRSVLLVTSDDSLCLAYTQRLPLYGLDLEAVPDGPRAIEAAQQRHFDVILLDVRLPGRSGPDVLRLLRSAPRTARTPVQLLAAAGDSDLVDAAMREGADGVIFKDSQTPVDVAIDLATMLGVDTSSRRGRVRSTRNVSSTVEEIARRLGSTAARGIPSGSLSPRGTVRPGSSAASRPSARSAVDVYRSQEQIRPRDADELRELRAGRDGHVSRAPPATPDRGPHPARSAARPAARTPSSAPTPVAIPAPSDSRSFDTVLNRFVGQAGALARAVGVSPDLTCPACQTQLVLRLWPDGSGRQQVCGHFVCPRCAAS